MPQLRVLRRRQHALNDDIFGNGLILLVVIQTIYLFIFFTYFSVPLLHLREIHQPRALLQLLISVVGILLVMTAFVARLIIIILISLSIQKIPGRLIVTFFVLVEAFAPNSLLFFLYLFSGRMLLFWVFWICVSCQGKSRGQLVHVWKFG